MDSGRRQCLPVFLRTYIMRGVFLSMRFLGWLLTIVLVQLNYDCILRWVSCSLRKREKKEKFWYFWGQGGLSWWTRDGKKEKVVQIKNGRSEWGCVEEEMMSGTDIAFVYWVGSLSPRPYCFIISVIYCYYYYVLSVYCYYEFITKLAVQDTDLSSGQGSQLMVQSSKNILLIR